MSWKDNIPYENEIRILSSDRWNEPTSNLAHTLVWELVTAARAYGAAEMKNAERAMLARDKMDKKRKALQAYIAKAEEYNKSEPEAFFKKLAEDAAKWDRDHADAA